MADAVSSAFPGHAGRAIRSLAGARSLALVLRGEST
jgi:hypothetical protein